MADPVCRQVHKLKADLEALLKDESPDYSMVISSLKRLQEVQMSLKILEDTTIGKTVNGIKKKKDADIAAVQLSKDIVKEWKSMTTKSTKRPSVGGANPNAPKSAGKKAAAADDKITFARHSDKTRMQMQQMFATALQKRKYFAKKTPELIVNLSELVVKLEEEVFGKYGPDPNNKDYKSKVRTLYANLTDNDNRKLIVKVLTGVINAKKLISMETKEMESQVFRDAKAAADKEALHSKFLAMRGSAHSTELQCPKCKKKNVNYAQAQTRSADEPMTTFCNCQMCGHNWKFS